MHSRIIQHVILLESDHPPSRRRSPRVASATAARRDGTLLARRLRRRWRHRRHGGPRRAGGRRLRDGADAPCARLEANALREVACASDVARAAGESHAPNDLSLGRRGSSGHRRRRRRQQQRQRRRRRRRRRRRDIAGAAPSAGCPRSSGSYPQGVPAVMAPIRRVSPQFWPQFYSGATSIHSMGRHAYGAAANAPACTRGGRRRRALAPRGSVGSGPVVDTAERGKRSHTGGGHGSDGGGDEGMRSRFAAGAEGDAGAAKRARAGAPPVAVARSVPWGLDAAVLRLLWGRGCSFCCCSHSPRSCSRPCATSYGGSCVAVVGHQCIRFGPTECVPVRACCREHILMHSV